MASFSATSFSTGGFSQAAFDFGTITPPVEAIPEGWASGSYVTRMSEAEFKRRRKSFHKDLEKAEFRIKMLGVIPELHEALIAPSEGETFVKKRAREKRLSAIIDKRIKHEHEIAVKAEADDEETILDFLIH